MKPQSDRTQAIIILDKLLQNHQSLSQSFNELGDVSALTKAICFGVCRHYLRLQVIADQLCSKRPKSPLVWLILLVGLYQLLYLDKPAYATVTETVNSLAAFKLTWAKGFVNAILRTFCRERETLLSQLQDQDVFLYGQPAWLLKRLQTDWPEQWPAIAMANDAHPPMSLRVNQRLMSRDAYLKKLTDAGMSAQLMTYSNAGLRLDHACSVEDLPGFMAGEVSLQDEAAQLAASLLVLEPGLRVLDACAAPGGKTCHLLERMPNLKECVALDVNRHRLDQVKENIQRLGLEVTLKVADAAKPDDWWDGKVFDRILLDAPCSALGVIRRHPDIKLLRSSEEIDLVTATQRDLLCNLWPLLRPGGILVYATCSVLAQENEQQIAGFLDAHADACSILPDVPWGRRTGHGLQILPGDADADGFFYSVLMKRQH